MAQRLCYPGDNDNTTCLDIDLYALEQARPPVITFPKQLATFSTTLKADGDATEHTSAERSKEKYTVQMPYKRALCKDPNANCKHLLSTLTPPFDLRRGYQTQIKKLNDNEFMSLLLECLACDGYVGESEFVCWRNLLTTISATPYEVGSKVDVGLIVAVQRIGDVLYMFSFTTHQMNENDERQKEMMYWGMKFESYVVGKPGQREASTFDPLNYNEEFCSVVKTKVGAHSIIFRGEIDCCRPDGSFVELKTSKEFDHAGHKRNFEKIKLIKWWLQSYLLGVPEILCGFRDDNGVVKRLQSYRVNELPNMMYQRKPAVCLAFLDQFLNFVKANVQTEFVPHIFQRRANSATFEMSLDREGKYKFIPGWFVDVATKREQTSSNP